MAVTLTVDALLAAMRLGDSAEELAETTRLLDYSTLAVEQYAPEAPTVAQNEAVVRLASQMYDQPTATRGAYSNALRNSGAARILMPYRIHRAGSTQDAIAVAQGVIGTVGNPVVNVEVNGTDLVITFADGTTETDTLPSGAAFGVDQDARDSAATAQTAADAAQAEIDNHEANHPGGIGGIDQTARDAAAVAQTAADTAQTTADTAETEAEAAQTDITAHEANHPTGVTDQTARDAAAANTLALGDKLERPDVNAGVGISVLATPGSSTAMTISLTSSGMGPTELSGGQWQWTFSNSPISGEVSFVGNAITPGIYEWVFDTGGAYASAQAELLALMPFDEIEIRQSATRHQLISVTLVPTLSGDNVTVTGTLDRGLSNEIPQSGANVTVLLVPGPIQGVDQMARDSILEHEASAHNTDTTARASARTAILQANDAEVDAATAQLAADAAQAAAVNADSDAVAAQATANTAQVGVNSLRTDLTAHETNHPGGGGGGGGGGTLPTGSDALDTLRWVNGRWTPVSPITQSYGAITRLGTFESLEALFNDVASEPYGFGTSANGQLVNAREAIDAGNDRPYRSLTMDAIWPVGEGAPYVWILTPSFYHGLSNFTGRFTSGTSPSYVQNIIDVSFVAQSYQMFIDGVPYDVGLVQLPLYRPADTENLYGSFRFDPTDNSGRTVTELAIPITPVPQGGGAGSVKSWHFAAHVSGGAWVANTARTALNRTFPIGPYADYAAIEADIADGTIAQIAVRIGQTDPDGADEDHGTTVLPNVGGFNQQPSHWRVFPGFALETNPVGFTVTFGAAGMTVTSDAGIVADPTVTVRVAVWA